MTKQLLAFIVGVVLVSAWWIGLSVHWNNDVQFVIPVITTLIFLVMAFTFFVDNWDK